MFSNSLYGEKPANNRLKQFWRIASRHEKLAANYTAMVAIACIFLRFFAFEKICKYG
ncbi:hypothetical protein [Nostoc sp.]|uniref:hypothetical protein n=1 Tax=Nostoc sp. TaxID=1180 RepID=UPI002A614DAD|nr:hypothetical protein [Nostoc sp. S13]